MCVSAARASLSVRSRSTCKNAFNVACCSTRAKHDSANSSADIFRVSSAARNVFSDEKSSNTDIYSITFGTRNRPFSLDGALAILASR